MVFARKNTVWNVISCHQFRAVRCVLPRILGFGLVLIASVLTEAALAQNAPTQDVLSQAQVFALSDVKKGQEGYALTAGAGNAIQRFNVRVEDLFFEQGQGFPYILIRASGPLIDAAGGIAAGMSGSPVYLDGRLAGAVSAGFPESDGRLGLVTPIEFMQRAVQRSTNAVASRFGLEGVGPLARPRLGLTHPQYGRAVPLSAPLLLSGLSGRAGNKLTQLLQARGIRVISVPTQTRAATATLERPYKLEPGAAVSAQLVTGDLVIGAVGTLTYQEGRNMVAFGHPVLGDVRARYAAAPAYVNAIVASRHIPFKLAENIGKPFGAFLTDRSYGLGGTIGSDPGFLPFEVVVRNGGQARTLRVSIAPVEGFLGALTEIVALSALETGLEGSGPGLATIGWTFSFTDRDPVTVRDRVADAFDITALAAFRAAIPVALVAENPFRTPGLRGVRLTIDLAPFALTRLVRVEPEARTVKPGQTVGLNVRLQPYRAAPVVRRIAVRIPDDAQVGSFQLTVRGGLTPRNEVGRGPRDAFDGLLTFEELLERLRNRISGENVLVETQPNGSSLPSILAVEAQSAPVSGLIPLELTVAK